MELPRKNDSKVDIKRAEQRMAGLLRELQDIESLLGKSFIVDRRVGTIEFHKLKSAFETERQQLKVRKSEVLTEYRETKNYVRDARQASKDGAAVAFTGGQRLSLASTDREMLTAAYAVLRRLAIDLDGDLEPEEQTVIDHIGAKLGLR